MSPLSLSLHLDLSFSLFPLPFLVPLISSNACFFFYQVGGIARAKARHEEERKSEKERVISSPLTGTTRAFVFFLVFPSSSSLPLLTHSLTHSNPSFFFSSLETPAISSLRLRATGLSLKAAAAAEAAEAAEAAFEQGKAAAGPAGRSETGEEEEEEGTRAAAEEEEAAALAATAAAGSPLG